MKYQKRNKLISLTISLVILLSISFLYCISNLNRYAIYYSSHIPHSKHKNPELTMVVSHIDRIKLPNDNNYTVNIDGEGTLIYRKKYSLEFDHDEDQTRINLGNLDFFKKNESEYFYTKNGEFLYSINNKWQKNSAVSQKSKANTIVSKIIDPIVKAQPKPKINLQWLFDWKYKDRFQ
ncbi:hypothetical protein BOVMAS18_14830 [Streptococcus uberis]